jgi:hypothetical protein
MEPNGPPSPVQAATPTGPSYQEHHVSRGPYQLYARDHPGAEPAIVLMHGFPDDLHLEALPLFSTPILRSVARPVSRLFGDLLFRAMYRRQVGRFFRDPQVRQQFLPLLYRQFTATPSAHEAFFGLNRDLRPTVAAGTASLPRLGRFPRPVRIVFGAADPYLNASTPGWPGASTSCSPPRSSSCCPTPATMSSSTSHDRSPG